MTTSFKKFFATQLNPAQQQAVTHEKGPLLVIAGAGSGKTRVITARIVHLITEQDVLPTSIIALTFTNKAAQEMRGRITNFLSDTPILPFIGTFHSYCLQLLKINAHYLPFSPFTIMDADDQLKLISSIVNRMHVGKKVSAKQIAYHISNIKNNALEKHNDPLVRKVFEQYEAEKKASHCFDFDDLLLETLRVFKKHPDFKAQFQARVRHILVDEYQDTNLTQHELLKEMALAKKKFIIDSLCAVGDEDQSIYSWRGATVENMLNFKKDFTPTTTVTIDQNYRSVQPILDSANHVIKNNQKRNPKNLWSTKKGSDRIRLLTAISGFQEAEAVAHALRSLQANKIPLTQAAILYRAHYQSRVLEEALIKNSIAYRIIGGIQFYERSEVKDLLAYLKLLTNPFDRVSFFRVVNTPSRGLGEKFEEQLYEKWQSTSNVTAENEFSSGAGRALPFQDICKQMLAGTELTKTKKAGLEKFLAVFDGFTHKSPPLATLEHVIKATSYGEYIKNTLDQEEAQVKLENIKELLSAVNHFQSQGLTTIEAFLNEVTLMQEKTNAKDDKHERVQLMTLHAAKGLEFNTVIITSLEEGILPSGHSIGGDGDIEEERRLMYVGITRAEERLLLTNARFRSIYGQLDMKKPSRFLEEIPQNLLRADDCSNWHAPQFSRYFSQWLGGVGPQEITSDVYIPAYKSASHVNTPAPSKSFSIADSSSRKKAKSDTEELEPSSSSAWKKNQPVKHATFGLGIIQLIEKKSPTLIHITAQFKVGLKKIDAKFLQPV